MARKGIELSVSTYEEPSSMYLHSILILQENTAHPQPWASFLYTKNKNNEFSSMKSWTEFFYVNNKP